MNLKKEKFKTIAEVARLMGLVDKKSGRPSTHTLRFWEKQFKQLNPIKLSGNRRYYSNKDLEVLKLINFLLKKQNLTIEGAKKALNSGRNTLDHFEGSSIKAQYYNNKIKIKSKKILNKIRKLNGKKNTY